MPIIAVTLQQFCRDDDRPRRLLVEAGWSLREQTLGRRLRSEELQDFLEGAEAVLAGVEPYDAALLAALPTLRCISRCGVGTDAIDLDAAERLGITVRTTPEEVVEPVAELTLAMILALARHLPQHAHETRQGRWQKRTGALLSEWTIGLIGYGRIGRAVERLLRPMHPTTLVSDPRLDAASELPPGVHWRALPELLAQADVVSLHAERPSGAAPILGQAQFALMKPGSYLVNTARGALLDEAALQEALASGRVAGAALDVFAQEPYAGPLATLPQVLCTPHIATLTRASRAAMEYRAASNVVEWFRHATMASSGGVGARA